MSLLIRNARVLTLAVGVRPRRGAALRDLGIIERGDVRIDGERIAAVGPGLEIPADAEVIDAQGRVLMPGFVDCHTHACWAGDPIFPEEPLPVAPGPAVKSGAPMSRPMDAIVNAVRAATRKQLASRLRDRLEAMLRDGTTTVQVKSGYGQSPEAELKLLQAIQRAASEWSGTVVPGALLGQGSAGDPDAFARMVTKEILGPVSHEFPGVVVEANCERDGWSVASCVRLLERAKQRGHPLRLSADQRESLGMVSEALRLGVVSVDHLEAASREDLLLLAQSHAYGVILPAASLAAGQRFARAGFFVDAGGAIALASDCNPLSAPGHSMPLAIALAVRFCGLTPAEAIAAATVNPATLLGLADRGTIAAGQRADLVLLHHRDERLLAVELGGNPVDLVLCAGRRPGQAAVAEVNR